MLTIQQAERRREATTIRIAIALVLLFALAINGVIGLVAGNGTRIGIKGRRFVDYSGSGAYSVDARSLKIELMAEGVADDVGALACENNGSGIDPVVDNVMMLISDENICCGRVNEVGDATKLARSDNAVVGANDLARSDDTIDGAIANESGERLELIINKSQAVETLFSEAGVKESAAYESVAGRVSVDTDATTTQSVDLPL